MLTSTYIMHKGKITVIFGKEQKWQLKQLSIILFQVLKNSHLVGFFLIGWNVFELFLQFTSLQDGKLNNQTNIIHQNMQIFWYEFRITWCMFRIMSDPPMNSPLMNICGKVGQWLDRKMVELVEMKTLNIKWFKHRMQWFKDQNIREIRVNIQFVEGSIIYLYKRPCLYQLF